MPIFFPNDQILQMGKILRGNTKVARIYRGATLIWPIVFRFFVNSQTFGGTHKIAIADVPQLNDIDGVIVSGLASNSPSLGSLWRSSVNSTFITQVRTNPSFRDVMFTGVISGFGFGLTLLWIAVGGNGTILSSSNGTSWTSHNSNTSVHLNGIAMNRNGGIVLVVGNDRRIVRNPIPGSLAGTWTRIGDVSSGQHLNDVVFADFGSTGRFVAVGLNRTIIYSDVNVTFFATILPLVQLPSDTNFVSVDFGDGEIRALSSDGTIVRSTNAIDWTVFGNVNAPNILSYNVIKFIDGVWYVGARPSNPVFESLFYEIEGQWYSIAVFNPDNIRLNQDVTDIIGFRRGILIAGSGTIVARNFD
ncbi:beta propeller repeat protein [Mongoliitalea daihaiensis]|uniref:hypothetical protein n=1 Tax=Mongoliitalea daihaiensis TaxID=2782006 RepID=UPI001F1C8CC8|nr:hypothetical protein [Mongoliitalea daihaiensis]UJP63978.1 hypothetical protein IPZ59_14260 [Mongoliitalea daihaiensis]